MVFEELRDLFQKVRLVIFDVDGVLTDGSLYYGPDGEAFKAFNAKDGLGIHRLIKSGIEVGIITGRVSSFVSRRAEDLGIRHVYQKKMDKKPVFLELCEKLALRPDQVAYMGDDIIDLPVLEEAGWIFEGWYTDSSLTTPVVSGSQLLENITLYAKWREVSETDGTFTITFNNNGYGETPTEINNVTSLPAKLPILTSIQVFCVFSVPETKSPSSST